MAPNLTPSAAIDGRGATPPMRAAYLDDRYGRWSDANRRADHFDRACNKINARISGTEHGAARRAMCAAYFAANDAFCQTCRTNPGRPS